jgi:hypothetical protein
MTTYTPEDAPVNGDVVERLRRIRAEVDAALAAKIAQEEEEMTHDSQAGAAAANSWLMHADWDEIEDVAVHEQIPDGAAGFAYEEASHGWRENFINVIKRAYALSLVDAPVDVMD